ncbi:hypothetical protein PCO80_15565 [Pectobacteriaceae bacterium C80]|nr:hypothetical protein PCO80_15565 [Pectobacteriaceae bacterium C80]
MESTRAKDGAIQTGKEDIICSLQDRAFYCWPDFSNHKNEFDDKVHITAIMEGSQKRGKRFPISSRLAISGAGVLHFYSLSPF